MLKIAASQLKKDMANILIAGGSGLIGTALQNKLNTEGHTVFILSRKKTSETHIIYWDPENNIIELDGLSDIDVVINLAGAGIADSKWTAERKALIINSRVAANKTLKQAIESGSLKPQALISASAIGIYGDRADEILNESSPLGNHGFLVESVVKWEEAISEIPEEAIRKVTLRIGIVLTTKGGALPQLVTSANLLTAAYLGSGKQYSSWIHIDDLVNVFSWAIENTAATGIYNAVGSNPISNKTLTDAIVKSKIGFGIPVYVPKFILRLMMGEMADVVLNSTRVMPNRLIKEGFKFRFEQIIPALQDLFKHKK